MIGKTILYCDIMKKPGEGGMGVVYRPTTFSSVDSGDGKAVHEAAA
jgi:hypothetical protein